MGSLAWEQAERVRGLHVIDTKTGEVSIDAGADKRAVINDLVKEYEVLFGRAAQEVCKEAAVTLLADLQLSEVPESLR